MLTEEQKKAIEEMPPCSGICMVTEVAWEKCTECPEMIDYLSRFNKESGE